MIIKKPIRIRFSPSAKGWSLPGALLAAFICPAGAQFSTPRPRVVDPPNPALDFISVAEFNTEGDAAGWVVDALSTNVNVTGGTLQAVSGQGSLIVSPALNIPAAGAHDVVEFRLRRSATDNSPMQLFWADDNGPFAAPERGITILPEFVPPDGEFHVYRLYLGGHIAGHLTQLRVDPTEKEGVEWELDYVRFGVKTVVVDPPATGLLNAWASLGEFGAKGVLEDWEPSTQVNNTHVTDGVLKGISYGDDAQLIRSNGLNAASAGPGKGVLEIRLKRTATDASPIEIFYDLGEGDFTAGRRLYIDGSQIPADGAFHVYQLAAGPTWEGVLARLRIDPTAFNRNKGFEIDYIRLGSVSPDADADGVPDLYETGTGVFVDSRDTGTSPTKADTDGDGFSDGLELAQGTSPVSGSAFPQVKIGGYTSGSSFLALNTPIIPNAPTGVVGTVNSFSVLPALPAGLTLDTATGVITGSPTELSAAAEYTVTAAFAAGGTASFPLTISVGNPLLGGYGSGTLKLTRGIPAGPLAPLITGPAPASFSVNPPLPAGLQLDTTTGAISGTPTAAAAAAAYTVTAQFAGYPDSVFPLSLQVVDSLVLHYTFDVDGTAEVGPAANFGPAGVISKHIAAVGTGSLRLSPRITGAADTFGQDGAWSSAPLTLATDARTIAFWVKVGKQSDGAATIISTGTLGAGTRLDLRLEGLSTLMRAEIGGGNFGVAPEDLGDGSWFHVAVTVAPEQAVFGDISYYIHDAAGHLLGRSQFNSTRPLALNTGASPVYIGDSYVVDGDGLSQRDFVGYVDDLRIYNTALQEAEVHALAQSFNAVTLEPLPFRITALQSNWAEGTVTLTWNSKEDRTYAIEWSETLEPDSWTTLPVTIEADAGATTTFVDYTGQAEGGRRFYRVIEN